VAHPQQQLQQLRVDSRTAGALQLVQAAAAAAAAMPSSSRHQTALQLPAARLPLQLQGCPQPASKHGLRSSPRLPLQRQQQDRLACR
jgi:hypothetical protein